MQIASNIFDAFLFSGLIISIGIFLLLIIARTRLPKLTVTPPTYAFGSILSFNMSLIYILAEVQQHQVIGLIGGYLLLTLALIQAFIDLRKGDSKESS